MPELTYHKATPTLLRDAGLDESWLQERILEDPSILGLGDLSVVQREKKQSSGGRLDFLMLDAEIDTMYEVEVMLGRLDESHIIRTIEYWDIERRRWPSKEHYAVIVAEEITNRFFNVIGLFNRAIPVIAVQLNAIRVDEKIILNFTKVLDIFEQAEEENEEPDTDRRYWEGRSNSQSLKIVDQCANLLSTSEKRVRITYRTGRIIMEGKGRIFAWFHPRRVQPQCLFYLRIGEESREAIKTKLEDARIDVTLHGKDRLRLIVRPEEMKEHEVVIQEALVVALQLSES